MRLRLFYIAAFLSISLFYLLVLSQSHSETPCGFGQVYETILHTAYQGNEVFVYDVSWSGGIKIGELHMEINKLEGETERYELKVRVQDSGVLHFFYSIDDTFVTIVEGAHRLPVTYDVHQKEGGSYEARRHTSYDQVNGKIRYQKNDQKPDLYDVKGEVHNEFSSFFYTRVLQLNADQSVIVPTFADGKRHEVVVKTGRRTQLQGTIFGKVDVLPVTPLMTFKGLYDKDGDTVIWFTDDTCRIPVRINSKILIGSITAELVSHSNPLCQH